MTSIASQPAAPIMEAPVGVPDAGPTDADLHASFVKDVGGPNPIFRCIHCKQTELGVRNCLADHWKTCRARLAAPAGESNERAASGQDEGNVNG